MAISLFESADRSTFLHETGHFFLEVYRDLAAMPDAPQQVRDDFDALVKWMGVESAEQIGRDQHEQFARGFEHYLAEGKAPSPELQPVFSQFKAWLRGIYRSLLNLDVNLTDDVRGIMDRMLASDEQIEIAQARQGMAPLARTAEEARALGMTEQQWEDYIAKVEAASEDAKAEVLSRLVRSQERALKRWWKEEESTVLAEVLAEYGNLPAERLARVLAGAKTYRDGTPITDAERVHLDRQSLVDGWGDAYLARLKGLYRNEGGVSPDMLAPLHGFESGDVLVKALANRGDMRARAEAEAKARMLERHGDPFADPSMYDVYFEQVVNAGDFVGMRPGVDYSIIVGADPGDSLMRFAVAPATGLRGFAVLRGYARPWAGDPPLTTTAMRRVVLAGDNLLVDGSYENALIICQSHDPTTITIRVNTGSADFDWRKGDFAAHFMVLQAGLGKVTVAIQAGGSVTPPAGYALETRAQGCMVSVVAGQDDHWNAGGDLLRLATEPAKQVLRLIDRTVLQGTNIVAGTGKDSYVLPYDLMLDDVAARGLYASLAVAQATGTVFTVDVNVDGVSIFATRLTFDNNERSTITAATPAVYSTAFLTANRIIPAGAEVTIDVDQVGTALAKGLAVYLRGARAS